MLFIAENKLADCCSSASESPEDVLLTRSLFFTGMDVAVTARIFKKLMERLGYSKYYVQGGDWGSAIATAMGVLYPERCVISANG